MSDFLQQHKALVGVIIAALVIISAVVNLRSKPKVPRQWYFDLGSQQLFAYDGKELPPITAPSGRVGVKAAVYSCGDCGESDRTIVYLQKFSDEDKHLLEKPTETLAPGVTNDPVPLIASVPADASTEPVWVTVQSSHGEAILGRLSAMQQQCRSSLKACAP